MSLSSVTQAQYSDQRHIPPKHSRAHRLIPHALIQVTVLSLPAILEVKLPRRPRPRVPAVGHLAQTAPDIGTAERADALRILLFLFRDGGNRSRVAVLVHVLDDAREEARGHVGAERPRGVPVADNLAHVGHVGQHGEAPHVLFGDIDGLAVDGEVNAAQEAQVQPRGGDDDVGVKLLAGVEEDAIADDALDGVGDNAGTPAVETLEEVAVRAQAQTLLPRVVPGLEVWVDGEVRGQLFLGGAADERGRAVGEVDAEVVEEDGYERELEAC